MAIEKVLDHVKRFLAGLETGLTPNWYYYWTQTSANMGTHAYNPAVTTPYTDYQPGTWFFWLGINDNDSFTPAPGPDNEDNELNGIDRFAYVCRHESRHCQNSAAWYPTGPGARATLDLDNDWLPDTLEATLGGTLGTPINGGPFDNTKRDTDGDGARDDEDYTYATQAHWNEGDANIEDWSSNGHQSH